MRKNTPALRAEAHYLACQARTNSKFLDSFSSLVSLVSQLFFSIVPLSRCMHYTVGYEQYGGAYGIPSGCHCAFLECLNYPRVPLKMCCGASENLCTLSGNHEAGSCHSLLNANSFTEFQHHSMTTLQQS